MKLVEQPLPLIFHTDKPFLQMRDVLDPFLHIFMPMRIIFRHGKAISAAAFLPHRCGHLPILEKVIIIKFFLNLIHFLLVAQLGCLECGPESLPFCGVHCIIKGLH